MSESNRAPADAAGPQGATGEVLVRGDVPAAAETQAATPVPATLRPLQAVPADSPVADTLVAMPGRSSLAAEPVVPAVPAEAPGPTGSLDIGHGRAVLTDARPGQRLCTQCGKAVPGDAELCPDDGGRVIDVGRLPSRLGEVIDGKFTLQSVLGVGGMGVVYKASQHSMERVVALKLLHPRVANDEDAPKRFLQEARAASRLNHPHVITVFDFGQSQSGELFLVMELLQGRELVQELRRAGRIPWRRAAEILCQVCDAVHHAHEVGVIHRDLKPENVFLVPSPVRGDYVKVLDFGIATIQASTEARITRTGAVCGTPAYVSPEQVIGEAVDRRSDVYSLGVMLFELVCGRLPFDEPNPVKQLMAHVTRPPPRLRDVAPSVEVPAALEHLVLRCMAKNPKDRPDTALVMATELHLLLEGGASLDDDGELVFDAEPLDLDVLYGGGSETVSGTDVGGAMGPSLTPTLHLPGAVVAAASPEGADGEAPSAPPSPEVEAPRPAPLDTLSITMPRRRAGLLLALVGTLVAAGVVWVVQRAVDPPAAAPDAAVAVAPPAPAPAAAPEPVTAEPVALGGASPGGAPGQVWAEGGHGGFPGAVGEPALAAAPAVEELVQRRGAVLQELGAAGRLGLEFSAPSSAISAIATTPPGASVYVDGQYKGVSPTEVDRPPPGKRVSISLRMPGRQTVEKTIDATTERLEVNLRRAGGSRPASNETTGRPEIVD